MKLTADFHTHTKYSHGKGSVLENALVAKRENLKAIGITDHGFSHPAFGLTKGKLPSLIDDCRRATEETGVQVLVGIESNIIGVDGRVDLTAKHYDKFDIFLAGVHKLVMYKPNSIFNYGLLNLAVATFNFKPTDALVKRNTKAYINVIKNNPVDILTHVGFCCPCNPVEVAKAAADYGTLIEISAKKIHFSEEQLFAIGQTGAKFVIDSDAHNPERVGEISLALSQLEKINFPTENIMNIDGRYPEFRFKAYKEKSL